MGNIHVTLMKLRQVIQEGMSFKEKVNGGTDDGQTDEGWMDDGRRPITIAHLEPLAQVS